MTRVDFYITKQASAEARNQLACRIIDKAYQLSHKIYVHTENAEQARKLDDMLWVYRAGSFVPHTRIDDSPTTETPVLIGHGDVPDIRPDVLINLNSAVPAFFSRFERVAEIVCAEPTLRQQGRERYRFYMDRGYPLETHELNS